MELDGFDGIALLDLDFAVCDELGGADVDVVASAAGHVFHEEAGAVRTGVAGEAGIREAADEGGVDFHHFFRGCLLEAVCDRIGPRHIDYVGVIDGRLLQLSMID